MTFLAKLLWAEVAGLVALLICAAMMGAYAFIESYLLSLHGVKLLIDPINASWLVFAYAGLIGFVGVVLYGAPTYALLRHVHFASWPTIVMVGALPGIVVLLFDHVGVWLIVGGVTVAMLTHLLSRQLQVALQ